MPRKIRSDIKIGNLEKKLGLGNGAIRNPDGSDARGDKKLGTLRAEFDALYGGPPVRSRARPAATGLPKAAIKKGAPTKKAAPKAAPKAKAAPKKKK